jgi:hypothetical protein
MAKKKRTKKTSQGVHGASKHPLTELQKVLLGKGMYRSWPVAAGEKAKRG